MAGAIRLSRLVAPLVVLTVFITACGGGGATTTGGTPATKALCP
jgi:hypothetical protein